MKLTSVELHPVNSSDVAVLSFRDPGRQNPYMVKSIDGLDADAIIARYYGSSGDSTVKFYQLAQQKRSLVIRIGLNPNADLTESFSSLRDKIYKLIASSRTGTIKVQLKRETLIVAEISGFVEKVEAGLFNKEQEVQITVKCSEPTLKAPSRTSIPVAGLDPAATTIVDSVSQAPHGLIFTLKIMLSTPSITITDPDDDSWSYVITPPGGFLPLDVIHFSSELNNKELYLIRSGVVIYLADVITPGSIWPIIFPGENKLSVSPATSVQWLTILHYPTYWGV